MDRWTVTDPAGATSPGHWGRDMGAKEGSRCEKAKQMLLLSSINQRTKAISSGNEVKGKRKKRPPPESEIVNLPGTGSEFSPGKHKGPKTEI